jgi:hypothetical protein
VGGQPCLQRLAAGTKAKEMGLECRPSGSEGMGEDTPFEPESSRGDNKEEYEDREEGR